MYLDFNIYVLKGIGKNFIYFNVLWFFFEVVFLGGVYGEFGDFLLKGVFVKEGIF